MISLNNIIHIVHGMTQATVMGTLRNLEPICLAIPAQIDASVIWSRVFRPLEQPKIRTSQIIDKNDLEWKLSGFFPHGTNFIICLESFSLVLRGRIGERALRLFGLSRFRQNDVCNFQQDSALSGSITDHYFPQAPFCRVSLPA